ncbi:hypothetical protein AVEN_12374-1, partial [Araneus ventricosus]
MRKLISGIVRGTCDDTLDRVMTCH